MESNCYNIDRGNCFGAIEKENISKILEISSPWRVSGGLKVKTNINST